ncbi:E3 ubiquitin-protein ligase PRT1-like isoform X3 [Bidens hawaiensis]|uniref:E3 ubiquitin-protein ligase PRT1-like isoform X3 n=1 Tax=Bidens hawaiensis TaxID=980011 RepID=UPI00404AEB70
MHRSRDLLYKPVVLVCGHVTCFWCCHRSMDMRGQSHCPLCRHPYRHFPATCQMLDVFIKKLYPISYGRRKKQALDDKQQSSSGFALDEELDHLSIADNLSSFTEENKLNDGNSSGNCKQVTVTDVLCSACKQLLFGPVVLNCGHVYCEACITIPEDGVIKCQTCQCRHPSGFPKVCKELDYVLEEQFSSEYALRKNSTQPSQEQIQNRNMFKEANEEEGSKFPYPPGENFLQWWTVYGSKFHPGVGCDICGMCPIIGDRYHCKDCKEKNSYDLCGDCYTTGAKVVPGRFNQKHTEQHQFELVKAVINHDVIYRLLSGQLAVVSAACS